MKIQTPVVAGQFYPADPNELRMKVRQLIASNDVKLPQAPKALIAPHAGYIYSGLTAGIAYAQLSPIADTVRRVVLLAPSHRVGFSGIAHSSANFFCTPLGELEVDLEGLALILNLPQVTLLDRAFSLEHSLEVHLPFLQEALSDFKIVPLIVGNADPKSVAEVLDRLWGGPETLIVISSDLSHFLDYESAKAIDAKTSDAIEKLQPDQISSHQACGSAPVKGLLLAAQHNNLQVEVLDLRNSGDTAGPRDKVVGYGAYAFS